MRLEGITISVGYDDYLNETLRYNAPHFDDMLVITKSTDKGTLGVCKKYGVKTLTPDYVFHEHGDVFNKARGIRFGLSNMRQDDWILHLDADIALPNRFRNMLEKSRLDETKIYGADRVACRGWDKWIEYRNSFEPQYKYHYMVQPPKGMPIYSRVSHDDYGWSPIGYFQLWNKKSRYEYPVNHGSAERTDLLFGIQWPPNKRELLPNLFCVHLEHEDGIPMGTDWNGRKTPRFGPIDKAVTPKGHHRPSHHNNR